MFHAGPDTNGGNPNSADDLIVEENEDVIKALKRLSPQDSYDRVYRIRRAMQCSLSHKLLPKEEWTKIEEVRGRAAVQCEAQGKKRSADNLQDTPYLIPIIQQIRAESKEKESLDSMTIVKNQ